MLTNKSKIDSKIILMDGKKLSKFIIIFVGVLN
jgi:restriction endonuclease Mrr